MEKIGESSQNRLTEVGGDALNDQPVTRDANGHHGAVDQEQLRATADGVKRRSKGGMPGGIHRRSMQRQRQVEQELAYFGREDLAV